MENFVHSDDEFLVQSKMESIHLNAIRWSRLKNTTANLLEQSKMHWVGNLAQAEQGLVR